ncbi:MAG: peptidase [Alcanivorax sp.]|nr:peptidase [Alcanivorax sp.]
MRSDVIRVYKTLHTWTGLIAGMMLFIGFYAGALTMFKDPLERWATPPQQQKVAPADWPGAGQWPALIAATLEAHPGSARGFTLHLRPEENTPAPLVWREGGDDHGGGVARGTTLDASGDLVTVESSPSAMAELIDLLHQTGGIPGRGHHYWGVYAMGVVCVLYVLALVSGLVVLLPTLIKDFLALRRGRNLKRFWLDAHNVVGITSLPFHLMIGLTVIVFAFHDQIYTALGQAVYGDRPLFERPAPAPEGAPRGADQLVAPATLLATLRDVEPGFEPRELVYSDPLGPRAALRVGGKSEGHMLRGATRGFAGMDPYSGEITSLDYLPGHEDTWIDIVTAFFALHFGNFGGPVIRWSYVLMGLGGAFLFYSGNLLWMESRRRKQRRGGAPVRQRRATRAMAAATVGVCWGCVAGVSAAMVAGKWVQGLAADANAWYPAVYYAVFLGSVAWAFWRGPARAAVELLWLSALATLAIPLTGLVAWLAPSLPPWVYPRPGLLSVEVSALLGGALLVLAARRTARRVRQGGADSVWSLEVDQLA